VPGAPSEWESGSRAARSALECAAATLEFSGIAVVRAGWHVILCAAVPSRSLPRCASSCWTIVSSSPMPASRTWARDAPDPAQPAQCG